MVALSNIASFLSEFLLVIGACIFLLLPTQVLLGLTEHGWQIPMAMLMLAPILFGVRYCQDRRRRDLWACCFLAGLCLNGRTETFVWPFYLSRALHRRFQIPRSDAMVAREARPLRTVQTGLLFLVLGALPFILFNVSCPRNSVLSFIFEQSVPKVTRASG